MRYRRAGGLNSARCCKRKGGTEAPGRGTPGALPSAPRVAPTRRPEPAQCRPGPANDPIIPQSYHTLPLPTFFGHQPSCCDLLMIDGAARSATARPTVPESPVLRHATSSSDRLTCLPVPTLRFLLPALFLINYLCSLAECLSLRIAIAIDISLALSLVSETRAAPPLTTVNLSCCSISTLLPCHDRRHVFRIACREQDSTTAGRRRRLSPWRSSLILSTPPQWAMALPRLQEATSTTRSQTEAARAIKLPNTGYLCPEERTVAQDGHRQETRPLVVTIAKRASQMPSVRYVHGTAASARTPTRSPTLCERPSLPSSS